MCEVSAANFEILLRKYAMKKCIFSASIYIGNNCLQTKNCAFLSFHKKIIVKNNNSISSSAEVVTELYERQYHACANQLYHSWRQISHALFRAARNSWLIAKVVQEFCCFNLIKISINLLVIQICFSLLIIHELERFYRGKFILSAE